MWCLGGIFDVHAIPHFTVLAYSTHRVESYLTSMRGVILQCPYSIYAAIPLFPAAWCSEEEGWCTIYHHHHPWMSNSMLVRLA